MKKIEYTKTVVHSLVLFLLLAAPAASAEEQTPSIICQQATQAPRIDGRLHDWDLTQAKTINAASVKELGRTEGNIQGDQDSSATLALSWDESHLYVAARVTDDRLHRVSEAMVGAWACDSIQLYLYGTEEGKKTGRFKDKATTKHHPSPFLGLSLAAPERSTFFLPEGSRCVTLPAEDGWTLEASVPLATMGYEVQAGDSVRFAAILVDSDPGKVSPWAQQLWFWSNDKLAKGEHQSKQWGLLVFQGAPDATRKKQPALRQEIDDPSAKKLPPERWVASLRRPEDFMLDGKLDEWNMRQGFLINKAAAKAVGRIDGQVDHDQDSSAEVVVAWDKEYLYLAAVVTDDRYQPPYSFSKPWTCDSVMLYLRSTEDGKKTGRYKDKATRPPFPHPFLAFSYTDEATQNQFLPKGAESIARPNGSGWSVEARVPLSALGFESKPDDVIRLGLILVDADSGYRSKWGQLCWMWSSTPQHDDENDWAAMRLLEERNGAGSGK